ncbi:MAG: hypothetical protein FJ271_11840 [Planctomycetes bacterium]|nr:hypothetical protein [Planctomycetota bacterium]
MPTIAIYRSGSAPPAAPAATASGTLVPAFRLGLERGEGLGGGLMFTHILTVPKATDVRDAGRLDAQSLLGSQDSVYVPDQNGTRFIVIWVERVGNYKRIYLQRIAGAAVNWPTTYL